ncbi:MAG: hypothetical protein WCI49_07400 [Ferruginibacter sp.]
MKKLLIIFCAFCIITPSQGQLKKLIAFPITGYIVKGNDSVQIVQLNLPEGLTIGKSEAGILKSVKNGTDTVTELGTGKCNLIKNNYYYFGIITKKGLRSPKEGDLLYTSVNVKGFYFGYLFNVVRFGITINSVEERKLADMKMAMTFKDAAAEQSVIDSLVNDVHYTGKSMAEQQNSQDMVLPDGIFKGKKLFATMQLITDKDVIAFLKYIDARPSIYAGNTWKFSEIFATWMASGTPTVLE